MFSKKTNNARTPHAFLIALPLILLNGSIVGLISDQLIRSQDTTRNTVKNETVVAPAAPQITDDTATDEATIADDEKPTITIYTVKTGDTFSGIADQFNISTNTILWANDLTRASKIKVGQKLTILPVTGVQYEVQKGDTISGIVKKFDGDAGEILSYNDLDDAGKIKVGMQLIIPNGEFAVSHKDDTKKTEKKSEEKKSTPPPTQKEAVQSTVTNQSSSETAVSDDTPGTDVDDAINNGAVPPVEVRGVDTSDYFRHPIPGSVQTQGRHGYNSVDFGAPKGTPVLAAADGVVIVEKGAGKWYGGYGNFIVIEHDNGTQTLYAHNSKNLVNVGDTVKQGQQIALSGSTGRSTGPHLHFEVRGGKNPWVGKPKGTQY